MYSTSTWEFSGAFPIREPRLNPERLDEPQGSAASRNPKSTPGPGAWATHAALLLVQFAFASQAVEAKVVMAPRDQGGEALFPESLAMMRMLGGAFFFQALALTRASQSLPIARLDHLRLFGLSILGISLNQALFLAGLRWTTPFSVSILGATIPVFSAALAVIFGKEKLRLRTALGIGCALAGVLWLTGVGSTGHQAQADKGAVLVAVNCLSYSAYVVLSRDIVLRLGALRFIAWVFTYGALSFVPIGIRPLIGAIPEMTTRGALYVAFIVAVPTIVAYSLHAWALARSSATLVTIYIYLQPLIAAVLAWLQLGHKISGRAALAAVLILVGLGIVASRQPAKRPDASPNSGPNSGRRS
jgi:drug/metabolite transporter (DMT)-like permease